jgi:hypothetical protein
MLILLKFQESIPTIFFCLLACLSCPKKSILKFCSKSYSFYLKIKTSPKNTHLKKNCFCYISANWNQFCFCLYLMNQKFHLAKNKSSEFTLLKHAYSTRLESSKHSKMSANNSVLKRGSRVSG